MKEFDFLKKHPYFHVKFNSNYTVCFEFVSSERNDFQKGIIMIPDPKRSFYEQDFSFLFSSQKHGSGYKTIEETPSWFQDIFKESKQKYYNITRIRKVVGVLK